MVEPTAIVQTNVPGVMIVFMHIEQFRYPNRATVNGGIESGKGNGNRKAVNGKLENGY